jgi:hypothetical protein
MQGRSRCLHTFRSSWKGRAQHVGVPWSLGPVLLRLHCSRGRAWLGRCRVSRFRPLSNRSSLDFRRRGGLACQLSVRIAARVFTLSDARNTLAACGGGGQTLASPTRAARIAAAVLPTSSAQPFVSQCGAEHRGAALTRGQVHVRRIALGFPTPRGRWIAII